MRKRTHSSNWSTARSWRSEETVATEQQVLGNFRNRENENRVQQVLCHKTHRVPVAKCCEHGCRLSLMPLLQNMDNKLNMRCVYASFLHAPTKKSRRRQADSRIHRLRCNFCCIHVGWGPSGGTAYLCVSVLDICMCTHMCTCVSICMRAWVYVCVRSCICRYR